MKKILSVFACLLILCVFAEAAEEADMLLKNCTVITMEESQPKATAVAIKGDKIAWVGEGKDAAAWTGKNTKVMDLKGAFVYPGLIESHAHIVSLGTLRSSVDLVDTPDKKTVLQKVQDRVKKTKKGDWILGQGWDQNDWPEKKFPSAADLDSVSPDNPVMLGRIDGHASWVNSRAMQNAGISSATKDPEGGKLLRDDQGNPTGVLVDLAMDLVSSKVPAPTKEESMERTMVALREAARKGITMIHDAGSSASDLEAFRALDAKGELPVRIYSMVWMPGEAGERLLKTGPVQVSPYLDIRGMKLMMDGALGSRGALMLEPYSDDPGNTGLQMWKEADLAKVLSDAKAKGIQVGIHAIGDRANRIVLNAYEKLGVRRLRWRIEHAQVLARTDLHRLALLQVIASMQPIHATSDGPWATDRLGPERVKGAYAWRSMLENLTIIAGGSDAPVEDINPLWGIYAAITRQDHNGKPEGGWHPEQIVTRDEALRMFTVNGAFASFKEHELGSVKAGKLADLVVLPANLLTCKPSEMVQMKVLYTIVGGKVRYPL